MLKLTKLSLTGFKSFPDKTDIEFNRGITAVIGPNGCGKSNIADSINWVLGEQSVRSLRGERMTDIIFQGTGTRKAMGMAEVVLQFTRCIHSEENEAIVISRKIYRDGRNDYILNGRKCRLKDIHGLLMDEGMGKDVYSVIEQGKIDRILSSRAYDRRLFIEEVAGVRKYREQKREAQLKLQRSSANLVRINDITNELGKRIGSLKRQASRARRFKELQARLRELKRVYFSLKRNLISGELENIEKKFTVQSEKDAALSAKLSVLEGQSSKAQHKFDSKNDEVTKTREAIHSVNMEIDRSESEIKHSEESIVSLRTRKEELTREISELEELLSLSGKEKDSVIKERENITLKIEEHSQILKELEEKFKRDEERFVQLETELEKVKDEQADRIATLTNISNRTIYLNERIEKVSELFEKYETEETNIAVSLTEAENIHKNLGKKLRKNKKEFQLTEQEIKTLNKSLTEKDASLSTVEKSILEVSDKLKDCARRSEYLSEMEKSGRLWSDSVKKLLEKESNSLPVNGVVADHIESSEGFETAAEAFFGNILGAIVTEKTKNILMLYGFLEEKNLACCPVLVPHFRTDSIRKTPPSSLGNLRSHLKATSQTGKIILDAIPDAIVTENLETALKLFDKNSDYCIVSLDGHVIRQGGFFSAPSSGNPGIFNIRGELAELKKTALQLEKKEFSLSKKLLLVKEELEGEEKKKRNLLEKQNNLEKEGLSFSIKLEEYSHRQERLQKDINAVITEKEQAEKELEKLKEEKSGLSFNREDKEEKIKEGANLINKLKKQLSFSKALYRDRSFSLSEAKAKEAELKGMLQSCTVKLKSYKDSSTERTRRKTRISEEIKDIEKGLVCQKNKISTEEKKLNDFLLQREKNIKELAEKEKELESIRSAMEQGRKNLKELQKEYNAEREILTEIEIKIARLKSDYSNLDERCREELNINLADLETIDDEVSIGEISTKLEECQTKIDNLGGVNLMAIEEHIELQERYDFLMSQKKDLTDSIESIKETIENIRTTATEKFNDTIREVNANFSRLFAELFKGGYAELIVDKEGDSDEAGVEIIAQPSGKKLQSIQLLSGGEKALTAIALLFGIFEYRPSPFCLLDEVDAALDDANIDRFTKMVEEKSKNTQFICITHNKRTMAIANVLYGVTMEQPGVSKIISAVFD